MKIPYSIKNSDCHKCGAGFTLMEMMITMLIFSAVVLGIVSLQLYAMRIYTMGATMVSAASSGRQTLDQIRNRIRSGDGVFVGTYNPTSGLPFVQVPIGSLQRGNALVITTTNGTTASVMVYYQDPYQTNISYFSNTTAVASTHTTIKTLANFVTNYYCFSAEDYQGNILTNYLKTPVIHLSMEYYQWQFPIGIIGGSGANSYSFYHLNTRIESRIQ